MPRYAASMAYLSISVARNPNSSNKRFQASAGLSMEAGFTPASPKRRSRLSSTVGRAYPAGGFRSVRETGTSRQRSATRLSYDWIASRRYLRLGVVA